MFASLVIEQEPLQWHGFPAAFEMWLRIMGGFAAVALVFYFVIRLFRGRVRRGRVHRVVRWREAGDAVGVEDAGVGRES